jgi:hypothetical protein
MRSFCVTAPLVAAGLSHFASSSTIRKDFGIKVIWAIESLLVVVVVNAAGEPPEAERGRCRRRTMQCLVGSRHLWPTEPWLSEWRAAWAGSTRGP